MKRWFPNFQTTLTVIPRNWDSQPLNCEVREDLVRQLEHSDSTTKIMNSQCSNHANDDSHRTWEWLRSARTTLSMKFIFAKVMIMTLMAIIVSTDWPLKYITEFSIMWKSIGNITLGVIGIGCVTMFDLALEMRDAKAGLPIILKKSSAKISRLRDKRWKVQFCFR